jgi:hypothetical protein
MKYKVKCDSTCLVTKSSTSPPGTGIKTWVPLIVSCKISIQYQYINIKMKLKK